MLRDRSRRRGADEPHRRQRHSAAAAAGHLSGQSSRILLIAKRGKDTAFLPENTEYYWQDSGSWYKKT